MPSQITEDLTGRTFHKWTVLGPLFIEVNGRKRTRWECTCICGTTGIQSRNQLVQGKSKGCRTCKVYPSGRRPRIYPSDGHTRKYTSPEEAAWYARYHMYRRNAANVDRVFGLTFEEFQQLCIRPCYYCMALPETRAAGTKKYYPVIQSSGIDRLDSSVGYIPSNCVPCCTRCNLAKGTLSCSDFIQMCSRVSYVHRSVE